MVALAVLALLIAPSSTLRVSRMPPSKADAAAQQRRPGGDRARVVVGLRRAQAPSDSETQAPTPAASAAAPAAASISRTRLSDGPYLDWSGR